MSLLFCFELPPWVALLWISMVFMSITFFMMLLGTLVSGQVSHRCIHMYDHVWELFKSGPFGMWCLSQPICWVSFLHQFLLSASHPIKMGSLNNALNALGICLWLIILFCVRDVWKCSGLSSLTVLWLNFL
jgi:hypothetical protein